MPVKSPAKPPPPPQIFKTPKIRPGKTDFKIKSTTSMSPTIQAAQPSQWDLASPGVKPMKTNIAFDLGHHSALETLGLVKEAVGIGGGLKGLWNVGRAGWTGQVGRRGAENWHSGGMAGRLGISGAAGALHNAQHYMKGMMIRNPGTAAGMIGLGGAGVAGGGILGAQAMFGGGQQKTAFLGAMMAGARTAGSKVLGAMGMGAGKGIVGNAAGAANVAGSLSEAGDLWKSRRAGAPIGSTGV